MRLMQKKIKVALAAAALLIFVLVVSAADRGT